MTNNKAYYSNLKLVVNKGEEEEKEELGGAANNVVYIGNIDKNIKDDDILKILKNFGVCKWNRQRNPSTNELMSFGFCEYNDLYEVYLCINILNNIKVGNKNLKVNCNDNLKSKFEYIVDILYEKREELKEDKQEEKEGGEEKEKDEESEEDGEDEEDNNALRNEKKKKKKLKNKILNDVKINMNNKKVNLLALIESVNNEYEEKKRKGEIVENNMIEEEKNCGTINNGEENDKEGSTNQDNPNIFNDINIKNDNTNFMNNRLHINKEDDKNSIKGKTNSHPFLYNNENNDHDQINEHEGLKENGSSPCISARCNNVSRECIEETKYLSKDYKVHWREKERKQKIENKEKDLEKDFYKREKEWLELEEQIKKDTYREWNKFMQVKKKDIAKLIELDLKGESDNSSISNSKKREIRKSKREKEKELDELDRLNELKEIDEMKRKEELQHYWEIQKGVEEGQLKKIKENEQVKEREEEREQQEEEEKEKEKAKEKEKEEQQANVDQEIKHNKDTLATTQSKLKKGSILMNALSYVLDHGSGKVEEQNGTVTNDDKKKKKDKHSDEKNEECMDKEPSEYRGEAVQCMPKMMGEDNTIRENNNSGRNSSDRSSNMSSNLSGNSAREEIQKKSKENEGSTNKRKIVSLEHINIKVNDKKKKKKVTELEHSSKINNTQLLNIFDTNVEDELYTKKHQPLSKLDKHLDKKNQEEERVKTFEIIENSKKILDKVPSTEEEIFNFPIQWNVLNLKDNISTKLKPWIYKKITEYIGTDEKEIIEEISNYFVEQILKETAPKDMVVEAEKFLDSDGKKFILNMYRLIIFEQLKIADNL
ncbi:conserved Plasmodium protein, unknown function [Plasmodium malariae]|uniref:RNA-binding protein 25 n=1 Tax=Plasmodium malariae TaxID=5858 RepID=A0A1C3KZY0_PLAMA|nr:conserved Plasmodium protein, unknown function [Plasmodium malariae]